MGQSGSCARCNAPRAEGPNCPRCGANYAKAEQIKAHGRAQAVERAVEIPAALLLGLAFHLLTPGLQRVFFGMPIHELGHAVTAWFCGHAAAPTLWRTLVAEERGWLAPLVLAGALGTMMWRAYLAEKHYLVVLGAALLVVQGLGTLTIKETTAHALFSFGGDGMGMVIATALMATFFFGKRTQLYKGWLRWGFLVIGAAAFSDMFATWVSCRFCVRACSGRRAARCASGPRRR